VELPTLPAPVGRRISPGEQQIYQARLAAGEYLSARIEPRGLDLAVALRQPDGRTAAEFDCLENESTRVSLIAPTAGVYRLEVRAGEPAAAGGYQVLVEERRAAASPDEDRVAAERAFAAGKRLVRRAEVAAERQALAEYRKALPHWQATGDQGGEARTLKAIGDVYQLLGESPPAADHYRQALALSREARDQRLESEILGDLGFVYTHLGRNQEARELCERALELSRGGGHGREEALALNNQGEVNYAFGQRQAALEAYRRALPIWQSLGDRRGQARTFAYLGYVNAELSEIAQAFSAYDEALRLWRAVNDPRGQAQVLTWRGHLHSSLGEKQEAINLYRQALPLLERVGDRFRQASVLNGLGYAYRSLGDHDHALAHYREALRIYQEFGYPMYVALARAQIGEAHHARGEEGEALKHLRQAHAASLALKDRIGEVYTLRNLGVVYEALGRRRQALACYRRVLRLYREGKDRRGEADALNDIGNVRRALGRGPEALGSYRQALALNRATADRFAEAQTLYHMARAEDDRGDLAAARARVEAALAIVESLRAGVASQGLRASYFASVQQQFEFYIDLLMRQHERRSEAEPLAAALRASEQARARSLLELIAEAGASIRRWGDPALIERARVLQQQINAKAERKAQLMSAAGAETAALARELDDLIAERDQVEAQIRVRSPRYAALAQPQPASLAEIQQLLDADTLLVEYALGDERSYLWAVTAGSVTGHALPARAEIERHARGVHELLTAARPAPGATRQQHEAEYWRRAAELSRHLLGPVADQLGRRRLLVVADGILQYIPFGALPEPGAGQGGRVSGAGGGAPRPPAPGPRPLIIDHEIVNLPSASTLAVLRRETAGRGRAPKAVAVLADPVFEADDTRLAGEVAQAATRGSLARLHWSRREAEAIRQATPPGQGLFVTDFAASRDRALSAELGDYRYIHFATHGVLDSQHPELSAIVLSLVDEHRRPREGYLRLHEIYNLNLPAELVVLSACSSGLGKEVKGEGLIGLTRGFMYAGASRVVASLWQVDDEATAELMKEFYGRMLRGGLPPAAALREAQLAIRRQPQWGAPYYWAAFVLQGEWR